MTSRSDQDLLQDYLDDRMAPEERAAWEARAAREPALARAIDSAKRVRTALREDPEPELGEPFYARARRRFETEARAHPPRGAHLLSWETMGLAAAAVLALALFAPWLIDRDPDPRFSPAPSAAARSVEPAEARGPLPAGDHASADDDAFADAPHEADRKEEASGDEIPLGKRAQDLVQPPTQAQGERLQAGSKQQARKSRAGRSVVTDPTIEEQPDAPHSQFERERGAVASELREAVAGATPERQDRFISGAWQSPAVVELPESAAIEGELVVLEDLVLWRTLRRGPASEALARIEAPRTDLRLVLVGPTTGVDCASLRVERSVDRYRILIGPGRPSAGGCALTLPRDGRSIVVDSKERSRLR